MGAQPCTRVFCFFVDLGHCARIGLRTPAGRNPSVEMVARSPRSRDDGVLTWNCAPGWVGPKRTHASLVSCRASARVRESHREPQPIGILVSNGRFGWFEVEALVRVWEPNGTHARLVLQPSVCGRGRPVSVPRVSPQLRGSVSSPPPPTPEIRCCPQVERGLYFWGLKFRAPRAES